MNMVAKGASVQSVRYNDILDDVTKVIKLLNGIDEKECSITVWNTVVDVIDILEEA